MIAERARFSGAAEFCERWHPGDIERRRHFGVDGWLIPCGNEEQRIEAAHTRSKLRERKVACIRQFVFVRSVSFGEGAKGREFLPGSRAKRRRD